MVIDFLKQKKSKLYKGFRSLLPVSLPKPPKQFSNPWINIYTEIVSVLSGESKTILGSLEANERIFSTIQSIYRGKI
jgi:hypothetical protein